MLYNNGKTTWHICLSMATALLSLLLLPSVTRVEGAVAFQDKTIMHVIYTNIVAKTRTCIDVKIQMKTGNSRWIWGNAVILLNSKHHRVVCSKKRFRMKLSDRWRGRRNILFVFPSIKPTRFSNAFNGCCDHEHGYRNETIQNFYDRRVFDCRATTGRVQ